MNEKAASITMLILLSIGLLASSFNLEPTKKGHAQGSIPANSGTPIKAMRHSLQALPRPYLEVVPGNTILGPEPFMTREFQVRVDIRNLHFAWYMVGVQFQLSYDPDVMEVVRIEEGDYLPGHAPYGTFPIVLIKSEGAFGPRILFSDKIRPNPRGEWNFTLPGAEPTEGGMLAAITFRLLEQSPTKNATIPLDIVETVLTNTEANEIPHDIPMNGSCTILSAEPADGRIDVWMQYSAPHGGQGLHQPADLVPPQMELILTAKVTNNSWPISGKDVTFEVRDPSGTLRAELHDNSDSYGLAYTVFRMPWGGHDLEDLLGLWNITVFATLKGVVVTDWMIFRYGHLIRIWKVTTDRAEYMHGETVEVTVDYGTYARREGHVFLYVTMQDELGVPIGIVMLETTVGRAYWDSYANLSATVFVEIPYHAFAGLATVRAVFVSAPPSEGGEAVAEEGAATFWILPLPLSTAGGALYAGAGDNGLDFWMDQMLNNVQPSSGVQSFDRDFTAAMTLSVTTDKSQYILRENVTVGGAVSLYGSPASDMLVSLEISDPKQRALIYRTSPVGNPNETWVLEIGDIHILDLQLTPLDTVKTGNTIYFTVAVENPMLITRGPVLITLAVVDGNQTPIRALRVFKGDIGPGGNTTAYGTIGIPTWAASGKAFIYVNVYDKLPSQYGVPYIPEKSAAFFISLTGQGVFEGLPLEAESHDSSSSVGVYESIFRISPTPKPGNYMVYAAGRYDSIMRATNTTGFVILDVESPPQASFVFAPLEPYPNETVTFDASSSTAEGYGDVIVRYEWDFGDGTPKVVRTGIATDPPDPTVTHNFMATGQYVVTLNVTDTEGYWSTAQRPITTLPTSPTAAFGWSLVDPPINGTVVFDATSSLPGWSIRNAAPAPIVQYIWNFGDSEASHASTDAHITHTYGEPGNFTVMLTIVDSENQQDAASHVVEVTKATIDVAVTNVTTSKTLVGQGFFLFLTATVENQGDLAEALNVTAYANSTIIQTRYINLTAGNSSIVSFKWSTAGFAKGNYAISLVVDTVPGETDTADNYYVDGWILVATVGDVTGPTSGVPDGKVDIRDLVAIAIHFGCHRDEACYAPNYDLTGPVSGLADGKIDIMDIAIAALNFGKIDP